jgi:hypothetical protein
VTVTIRAPRAGLKAGRAGSTGGKSRAAAKALGTAPIARQPVPPRVVTARPRRAVLPRRGPKQYTVVLSGLDTLFRDAYTSTERQTRERAERRNGFVVLGVALVVLVVLMVVVAKVLVLMTGDITKLMS